MKHKLWHSLCATSTSLTCRPALQCPHLHMISRVAGAGDGRGPCAAPRMMPLAMGRGEQRTAEGERNERAAEKATMSTMESMAPT